MWSDETMELQRLVCILFQMDEACRYIRDGRLERLRLALLLLDNATELQMEDRIRQDLGQEDVQERLRDSILEIDTPLTDLPESLQEIVDWEPLTAADKVKLDRFFEAKLRFLAERRKEMDPRVVHPLAHLHRYRNEAFHRGWVRPETILTAAIILLEINCQLLITMMGSSSFSSGDDCSWLKERFGVKPDEVMGVGEPLEAIVEGIRSEVLPDDSSVALTLRRHFDSRLDDLESSLDFIVEVATGVQDRESALAASQEFKRKRSASYQPQRKKGNGGAPYSYSVESIQSLRQRAETVGSATSRLAAFEHFSHLEQELEPLESCVEALALALDMAIQTQIDLSRGK
jgi:hypothetical protein